MQIVSAYKGQARYVEAARLEPSVPLETHWMTHAIDAYWDQWAGGQWAEERTRRELSPPMRDLAALEAAVTALVASGVETQVEAAFARVAAALPKADDTVICIMALDPADTSVPSGVVGSGTGDNMLLRINPAVPDWQTWVPWVVAHEYHHSVWGYHYFYLKGNTRTDMLTSLIIDGQADSFAKSLYPHLQAAWTTSLTPEQEASVWAALEPHLTGSDPETYVRFMFGDKAAGIPWCAGYCIGYRIVQAYLAKHPEVDMAHLLDMDPWEIFRESGYSPTSAI